MGTPYSPPCNRYTFAHLLSYQQHATMIFEDEQFIGSQDEHYPRTHCPRPR